MGFTFHCSLNPLYNTMLNSRNAPQPAPPGMKPAPVLDKAGEARLMSEAKGEMMKRYKAEQDRTARPFNQQIDKRLDLAHGQYKPDPKREAKGKDFEKAKVETLSFKPPDRDDRSR